jgi:4-amino-4-deoxy-L-arabinose transferase-like glycosyltransferase
LSDRLLIVGALLFGLASVLYPFGGDQGLYYYVGREWLSGTIPYRDVMEQKTPLVFALHALLVFLTGQNMWAIRVAELVWIPLVGLAVAGLATPEGERRRPGVLGVACLTTSMLYFGLFNYWETAQCEIWYAGLSLLSLWVVARLPISPRNWVVGGMLGGLALLMKPPAAFLLAVVVLAMAVRVYSAAAADRHVRVRAALGSLLLFGAGAAAPLAAVALYFANLGALDELVDLAFHANYHDMIHSGTVAGAGDVLQQFAAFATRTGPWALASLALALVGSVLAVQQRSASLARRYGVALALLVAGGAAIAVQRKFYGYHWGVLVPLIALPLVCLADDLSRVDRRQVPQLLTRVPMPLLFTLLLAIGFATTDLTQTYATTVGLTARYAAGQIPREQFLTPFVLDNNTPYAQQEVVGRWIRAHSTPADLIAVRGFEQTVYAVAHRRAPTRFFWTRWLTEPRRSYKRSEWLAEDHAALERNPPRYVVVGERAHDGPASKAHFESRGYVERFRHGRLIVLERRATHDRHSSLPPASRGHS